MGSLSTQPDVYSIQVHPETPERVYAAGPAGVFRADDGGLNWQPAGQGLKDVTVVSLALDPVNPDTLFAITAAGAVFRSDDGASTWQALK